MHAATTTGVVDLVPCPVPICIIGIAHLLAIRMRNWLYLLPLAPTVINSGSWLLLATGHDFRYQYGVYLIAPIAVALITARSYTSAR